jgi:hypothetical protein
MENGMLGHVGTKRRKGEDTCVTRWGFRSDGFSLGLYPNENRADFSFFLMADRSLDGG